MITQKELTQNWAKLYQCASKPMVDLAELNFNTMNNWVKNTASVEKPEDILAGQTKLVSEMTQYTQKAMDISVRAMSEIGKVWTDILRDSGAKASELSKTSMGSKQRDQ